MADFDRINSELAAARRAEGGPYQSTIQNVIQTQFQSRLDFAATATAQLLHSAPSLKSVDLVLTVSAVTPTTGTPAWPEDITNIITNLQMSCGGNLMVNLAGNQISMTNKSRASISGLAALEVATLVNQTLAQRQAAATAQRTFIIHLPLPCDQNPIPYSVVATDIQIQITLNSLNNILEAGTGTASMVNAYLNCTFLPTPPLVQPVDRDILAEVNGATDGVDSLFIDSYQMQYQLLAGTTTYTAQLNQLRNSVKQITFAIVSNADLTTVGNYKPTNYLPISTFQMVWNGNNTFSQQPIDGEYSRLRCLANSGFLNYSSELVYGFVPDGGSEGSDHVAIDVPYGGGLSIGPANTGAPEITFTFPSLGGNSTLFVLVEAWNALRYTPAGGNLINFRKVLN